VPAPGVADPIDDVDLERVEHLHRRTRTGGEIVAVPRRRAPSVAGAVDEDAAALAGQRGDDGVEAVMVDVQARPEERRRSAALFENGEATDLGVDSTHGRASYSRTRAAVQPPSRPRRSKRLP
jgi:hypothetical protein